MNLKCTSRIIAISLLASTSIAAMAQTSKEPALEGAAQSQTASDVGEIIVTAQKRTERLQDVPLSVTALSGDQLTKQGVFNAADLAKVVPGFTYQNSTFGAPIFTIRGIGLYDNAIATSPTVTVYVDQVPLPYSSMAPGASLDLERVEVLKGPQGTLFGQNVTGGAVNYIAAKPTSEPHMGFDLSYGRFNAVTAQGYVSGPIGDTLAVRVSAKHEYRDAWQKSETRAGDELGRRDFTAGRILVDWKPSDRFSLELNVNGWRDKSDTVASQFVQFRPVLPGSNGYPESTIALSDRAPARDNARVADWDPNISLRRDDWLYQLGARADWELSDKLTFTSITAYTRYRTLAPNDPDGTDFDVMRSTTDAHIRSFSQEARLAADLSGTKLTGGINYQNDKSDEHGLIEYIGSNSGVGPYRYTKYQIISDQRVKTYGTFASAEVPIAETLTAQIGGRYTKQNRDFQGCLRDSGDGQLAAAIGFVAVLAQRPYNPGPPGSCVSYDDNFNRLDIVTDKLDQDNWSWRVGLDWKPDRDTTVYGNVTRGYKAGTFTTQPAIYARQLTPVTQEEVTAYEVGAKLGLFDRLLAASGAIFYYDYRNKQINGTEVYPLFGALPQLINIPKSNVRGAELDVTMRPMQGVRLRVGTTYVKSEVSNSFLTSDPLGATVDVKGEAFPNTPRWQVLADGEYAFPLASALQAYVGGSASYRSASNAAFGENPIFRLKPYTLVDLRAGIGADDEKWGIEIWGRNVFNTFYWTNVAYVVDTVSRTPGMSATYGVTLRTRF